jgi:hypothetical protein
MDIEKNPGPVIQAQDRNIRLCNMNLRSINAKSRQPDGISRFTALKAAVTGSYDIVTCTETWLKHDHPDSDYDIPGYLGPYRLDRCDNTGYGGVAAWVIDSIKSNIRPDLQVNLHETMWIEVKNSSKHALIGVTYRQNLGRYAPGYWENLQSTYDKAVATKIPNIVLTGDLNADYGTDRAASLNLDDFMFMNNLTQHIDEPTRIATGVASKLDLIMSNLPLLITQAGVTSPVHENDHRTIFGLLNMKTCERLAFKRNIWEFKKANFDEFRTELNDTNWDNCFSTDSIDEICDKWTEQFLTISKDKIPNKTVTIRPQDKNWFNNHLRNLRRSKDRKYCHAAKNRTPSQLGKI